MSAGDSPDLHADIDVLADLACDARDDAQTRAARAHLDTCETCAATYDALVSLPAAMVASAAAETIPAAVALRIDAALVRASDERAGASTARAASVTPLQPRRRASVTRWVLGTAAAAAAAVVATVVLTNGVAPDDNTAADGPDSAAATSGAGSDETQRSQSAPGEQSFTAATTGPTATATTAATSDLDAEVLALIAAVEATKTSTKISGSDGSPTDDADPYLGCTAAVAASTGREAVPIAGELTTYGGKSAVLLVFSHRGDDSSSSVDAYVLPASCLTSSSGTASAAPILRQTTVHR